MIILNKDIIQFFKDNEHLIIGKNIIITKPSFLEDLNIDMCITNINTYSNPFDPIDNGNRFELWGVGKQSYYFSEQTIIDNWILHDKSDNTKVDLSFLITKQRLQKLERL